MITGAGSGIGKALALAFAREGNPLLLISRQIRPIDELAGHPVVWRQADVAVYAAVETAVNAAEASHGPVECLVNCAGIADARAFDLVEPQSFAREIDTNLLGVLNCTKAVLSGMAARQSGTIVNISSISDRKAAPVALAYTASKYAVRAFSESLREAQSANGVRHQHRARLCPHQHPCRHAHHLRRIPRQARQSRFHDCRAIGRDHPVLLEAAAGDLHPRPGDRTDADHLLTRADSDRPALKRRSRRAGRRCRG
jgi:NADP-dependent 3-hydroxy acid dehydrogenase YdfG